MKDKTINNIKEIFFKIYPAQVFVVITSYLSGVINGLITGNYLSSTAMVALGFVAPLTMIFSALSSVISGGSGILCGNYMGRGETKKVNEVFSLSMILLLIIGAGLTAICLILASSIALICGATGTATADTAIYIRGLAIGLIPLLMVPCLMTFLQMCNKSNFSLFATIIMAIFNLIFGLLNVKVVHLGIFGVGLSTSLSYFATLLIIFLYFKSHNDLVKFDKNIDFKLTGSIFKYGSGGAMATLLYSFRNIVINGVALKYFGSSAVNALAILCSCGGFFDAFNIGMGSTVMMLSSVFVGERDTKSLKTLMSFVIKVGLIIGFAKVIVIYIFSKPIGLLFGAAGEVITMFSDLLRYYSWCMPLNMIYTTFINTYCALGRIVKINTFHIITAFLVPVAAVYTLPTFMGLTGIWICYFVAEVTILVVIFVSTMFIKKGIPTCLDDYLNLPDNFAPSIKYSKSIKSVDEVIGISKDIEDLCKNNGVDSKRTYFASLCSEEMADNIVEHGFTKDSKENTVDVLVFIENGDINIRFRDNCVPFNPNDKLNVKSDDSFSNIGIKMVNKIAKEMNYQTIFGLNVLSIKL